jgi:iron complex outermembrane receptor protein
LEIAVLAPFNMAYAQSENTLPPVSVQAPPKVVAKRPAKPTARTAALQQAKRPAVPVARPTSVATAAATVTPSAARDSLNKAPTGQTATTIDRSQFENKPVFSVADLLGDSPGIDMKQGNGPRDIGISIRGSNARNGFGIRNVVILDDGFPVTQPDGLSRSDLIDPHAYGAIDVMRGPSSALYGNYATGGALNFQTRPGSTINGFEYGVEGGSFGYLNNYLTIGQKVGNAEVSLFASNASGDGFIQNSWFNTQTSLRTTA